MPKWAGGFWLTFGVHGPWTLRCWPKKPGWGGGFEIEFGPFWVFIAR